VTISVGREQFEQERRAVRIVVPPGDKDGGVSIDELRAYSLGFVAKMTDNRQHPTIDRDNLTLQLELPIASNAEVRRQVRSRRGCGCRTGSAPLAWAIPIVLFAALRLQRRRR